MRKAIIRKLRSGAGVSIDLMAERVGCSLSTYKRWEKGTTEPRVSDLLKIAQVLGVPAAELI